VAKEKQAPHVLSTQKLQLFQHSDKLTQDLC